MQTQCIHSTAFPANSYIYREGILFLQATLVLRWHIDWQPWLGSYEQATQAFGCCLLHAACCIRLLHVACCLWIRVGDVGFRMYFIRSGVVNLLVEDEELEVISIIESRTFRMLMHSPQRAAQLRAAHDILA